MGIIAQSVLNQYDRVWSMLLDAIDKCPESAWQAGVEPLQPVRMALHASTGAAFYGKDSEEMPFEWCEGTGPDSPKWFERALDEMPSREAIRAYTVKIQATWTAYLSDKPDEWFLSKSNGFPWTGENRLEQCMCNMRHMMIHVGHLDVTIRENGGEEVEWH
jgi:hypothetical protein